MKNFAIIFSGQSLYNCKNMYFFFKNYSIIKKTFAEASNILKYNLWKKCMNTQSSQTSISKKYISYFVLIASIAKYRLWIQQTNMVPKIIAGHSLGQYSALVCNNNLKLKDALIILQKRNKIIDNNTKNVSILMIVIIGLHLNTISKICKKMSSKTNFAKISCINSNNQIVVAGFYNIIQKIKILCICYGAKLVVNLPIYSGLHTKFMLSKKKKFSFVRKINIFTGKYPIINNVDSKILRKKKDILNALTTQLYKKIQWKNNIDTIIKNNIHTILEIGPGKILTNIHKQEYNIQFIPTDSIKNFLYAIKLIQIS